MARIKGSNITKELRPEVELVSATQYPVGTLFSLWHGSRHEEKVSAHSAQLLYATNDRSSVPTTEADIVASSYPEYFDNGSYSNVIEEIAKIVLKANVPASECVNFTFCIDEASVALREQMVRSKFASYWTQTSRTADLNHMDINMSKSIGMFGGDEAVQVYQDTAEAIRKAYQRLTELGVPTEDIRLSPESRTHRIYWMISARALMPILSKRTSWIAQATLWSPIVSQVTAILRDKVDPIFTYFSGDNSDCTISDGKVTSYKYDIEVEDRYYERDPQPCCPLWLAYRGVTMPEHTDIEFYDYMKSIYIQMWKDEILEVLDWDRKNPNRIGKYDRPASWFRAMDRLDEIKDLSETLIPLSVD